MLKCIVKRRDFIKKIQAAGWTFQVEGGEHTKYQKKSHHFAVPRHNEVKIGTIRAWEKLNKKLDDDDA